MKQRLLGGGGLGNGIVAILWGPGIAGIRYLDLGGASKQEQLGLL